MDNNEARYILGKLIGNISRDTFINSLRSVTNTDFKKYIAYRRYTSTLINLANPQLPNILNTSKGIT